MEYSKAAERDRFREAWRLICRWVSITRACEAATYLSRVSRPGDLGWELSHDRRIQASPITDDQEKGLSR